MQIGRMAAFDSSMSTQTANHSSWRRILLAWYLDFLFYCVLSTLASYAANWGFGKTWAAEIAGFAMVRSLGSLFSETPGMIILGIRRDGTRDAAPFTKESWLTMLLGTVFVLDGAKQCVRWTEYASAWPDFGVVMDETGQVISALIWGVSYMAAGILILRLRVEGFWLAFLICAAGLLSLYLSWSSLDSAIVQEVVARRAAQGLAVRPDDIEFMQALLPGALVVGYVALLGLLAALYRRFG
jgi:hypothetical protein